jgi:uncharacterized protein YbjT (DUF2867 family)
MKIVVIGGSGLIGSKLVTSLGAHGHEAVAASPEFGVDTLTGDGLAEALEGASVVVDVSNSPSFEDAAVLEFFETSTRNLLAAEAAAGVEHHVALSVVGTERLSESGYFRAKIAQEKLIRAASWIPPPSRAPGCSPCGSWSASRSCFTGSTSSATSPVSRSSSPRWRSPLRA